MDNIYTLFGTRNSGAGAVDAALGWAGLSARRVEAASWIEGETLDELGRANPLRQIPTLLLPDGSVMTESAAILIHLGLAHPASGLLPADEAQRAQAVRGLVFIAANLYAAISVIDYPERWCANADDDAAVKERIKRGTRDRLHRHWDIFATQFAAGAETGFLLGAEPGALDILASVVSRWAGARQHLQQMHPALHALLLRVDAHPRLAAVFEHYWPSQGT